MLRSVPVSFGSGGRLTCARCGEAGEPAYRPAAELAAEIEAAVASQGAGRANVTFGGADPFGHPELPDLVDVAVGAGVARLRVDTDGTALARAGNAEGAIRAGVRHMRVRLLGGDAASHDATAHSPGHFDAVLEGLAACSAASSRLGLDVALSGEVPLCAHAAEQAPAAVAALARAGCGLAVLRADRPAVPHHRPDRAAAARWVAAACDTGVVNGIWVWVVGMDEASLPDHSLHLAPGPVALTAEDVT